MNSLTSKYIGKYLGPDAIADIVVSDQLTASGSVVFEVTLQNGKVRLMPERAMAVLATDEVKDYNFLRDRREFVMIPEIVKIIGEYDVPIQEVPHLVQMIAHQIDNHFGRAANWLWTKRDANYVAGGDAMYDVTLLMADKVISEIPKDVTTE